MSQSQFDVDLGLFKQIEPAARPIDTFAPVRIKAPDAGSQLRELAEGLSTFNKGLTKFGLEQKAEQDEKDRVLGEADAAELTQADRIEIARQGIRDAEKAGLIPKGLSPVRLIAIQEAVGRDIARDYESRAFALLPRLTDPTNNENIDEAFEAEWQRTQLQSESFYITSAALKERADIDQRLIRQATIERGRNTYALNKEQHADDLARDLDIADSKGEEFTTEKIEAWMNKGRDEFGASFFEEGWQRIQAQAFELARDGKLEEAEILLVNFENANPSGQKNADMGRKYADEISLAEARVEELAERYEENEKRKQDQERDEARQQKADEADRIRDAVGELVVGLGDEVPDRSEFRELVQSTLKEKGFSPALIGRYMTDEFSGDYSSLQDPQAKEDVIAALAGARTLEELRSLADQLGASRIQLIEAERRLETKRDALLSRVSREVSLEFGVWNDEIDVLLDDLPDENRELRAKIIRRELGAFQAEVDRVTKEVRSNNPDFSIGEVALEVKRRMAEWNTENIGRLNNADDVNSPVNEIARAEFKMPSLSQLPTELDTDQFTSTDFFTTDIAFLTGEVRNYFQEETLDGRTRAALEIQSKLKREFDAIKFNFARSVGDSIDQEGITARRYRTATLFSGVSIDDLKRGTFENGVTVTESLRDPKFTPFFPNKKALEDALDEYDNAAPEAQSGTLIGRLITELGAENTGTADQFATMQGLLLQRRGMN
tara:strand:+ start:1048 stop:3216 length:2169 start_codon:yes stop_codon:yes gene_type:complete